LIPSEIPPRSKPPICAISKTLFPIHAELAKQFDLLLQEENGKPYDALQIIIWPILVVSLSYVLADCLNHCNFPGVDESWYEKRF
jgi:hypothetical protein